MCPEINTLLECLPLTQVLEAGCGQSVWQRRYHMGQSGV